MMPVRWWRMSWWLLLWMFCLYFRWLQWQTNRMHCECLVLYVTCLLSYALAFTTQTLTGEVCVLTVDVHIATKSFTIWAFYIHSNTHHGSSFFFLFFLIFLLPFFLSLSLSLLLRAIGNTELYVCGHTKWNDERRQEKWMKEWEETSGKED